MASSLSPDQYGKAPQQLPYSGGSGNGGGGSDQEKGPLSSLNLGFLKSLTEKRTTRGRIPQDQVPAVQNLTIGSCRWQSAQEERAEAR